MPSSHGGGFSGGGGGFHSSGGGSHGGGSNGGNRGPRYSRNRPFPGATRYYYVTSYGVRRSFYYDGVPKRIRLINVILPVFLFVFIAIFVLIIGLRTTVPHKLKASKCTYYDQYIMDADNIFTAEEEKAITKSLTAFYNKTGIQPYVYVFNANNLPAKYGNHVDATALENYSYDVYVNTFDDEGHWLIMVSVEYIDYAEPNIGWIDQGGIDANECLLNKAFGDFQSDMQKNLAKNNLSLANAITISFNNSTNTIMKVSGEDIPALFLLILVALLFIIIPAVSCVKSIKQAKEINEYCDYRDKNGGVDYVDGNTITTDGMTNSSDNDGSDLFD